jgi:hypothetical protein
MNIDQVNALKVAMAAEEKRRAERAAAEHEAEQNRKERAAALVNHHLRHPDISYGFRPLSYWALPSTVLELALRNVKGRRRQEMIRDYYEEGRLEELLPTLTADELSNEDRKRLGGIHPSFMGGANICRDIAGTKSRLCGSSSSQPHQMSSVSGPDYSEESARGSSTGLWTNTRPSTGFSRGRRHVR